MNNPLVSVLMTSYNREKYIAEAIESVLASTYKNFELIICDDRSSDETVVIAKSFADKDDRIKLYVNEKNIGDYLNRNRAAELATGKYIKYLDSDDVIYDFGLEVMVRYMEKYPEAGFGLCSLGIDRPVPQCLTPRQTYLENFTNLGHFSRSPGSSIINLDAFRKVGGFSGLRMIGDFEFWFKIARHYNMVKLPYDLHWCRVHPASESSSSYAKLYPVLSKKVIDDALSHPDCPLSQDEIIKIQKELHTRRIKQRIRKMFFFIKNPLK